MWISFKDLSNIKLTSYRAQAANMIGDGRPCAEQTIIGCMNFEAPNTYSRRDAHKVRNLPSTNFIWRNYVAKLLFYSAPPANSARSGRPAQRGGANRPWSTMRARCAKSTVEQLRDFTRTLRHEKLAMCNDRMTSSAGCKWTDCLRWLQTHLRTIRCDIMAAWQVPKTLYLERSHRQSQIAGGPRSGMISTIFGIGLVGCRGNLKDHSVANTKRYSGWVINGGLPPY